jgi:hypothetical protein
MSVITGVAVAGLVMSGYQAYKANQQAKGMQAMSEEQFKAAEKEKRNQQAKLDKQKDVYRQMKFENPYANMENRYAGLQTSFENIYEDLTVGTEAADFQMEQGAQQRANIMQQFRGAAGGSGIAALAQSLANQGTLQARQVSVDITRQEQQNQMAKAAGAASARQLGMGREQLVLGEQARLDMAERGGEAMLQEAESSRQATLLGMQYGESAGANAALQQAQANQMSAMASQMQMHSDAAATYGKIGMQAAMDADWGQVGGGGGGSTDYGPTILDNPGEQYIPGYGITGPVQDKYPSDRRLKNNINRIDKSPSGLNIYSFKYIDSKYGEGTYQGVMSNEIPSYAVSVNSDGYDMVDYSKIDVNFKQI